MGQRGVAREVGLRVAERGLAEPEEAGDVPVPDVGGLGVDVHREVEEVADREAGAAVVADPGRLEDVEPLDDHDVRVLDVHLLVRDDVVGEVVVDRRRDLVLAGLDVDDEPEQRPAVVGLGEALALEQPAPLQLGVRVEEAVGGDQGDVRVLGPVRQQVLEHARGGGLADRDRAGEADDERRAWGRRLVEELLLVPVQAAGRLDVQAQEPADREEDLADLLEVQRVAEAPERGELVLGERVLHLAGERGPGGAVELGVGGCLAGLVTTVVVPAVGHGEDRVSHRACSVADPGVDRLAAHVRDRRVRRGQTGPGRRTRRAAAAGVPRLRLRRDRRRGRFQAGGLEEGRQAREPREGHRRRAAARVDHRRGAHPLGHPRRAERRQRPPAPRLRPPGRAGAQRDHRELRRAAGPDRGRLRAARPGLGDRHRGGRPAAGAAARSRTST